MVELTPAEGYVLEIPGTDKHPFVPMAAAAENLTGSVEAKIRQALGITGRLTIRLVVPDDPRDWPPRPS
ncbi:hypothetical protein ACFV1L_05930 [Kitasatospora sp. NPDC059646]|uniref:hypothetical protein n=1 Tax=Kitasatospora sp. NPDC059646 TaxID=3346893 RepID=UPI0036878399